MSRSPSFCAFSFSKSGENVIQDLLNKHLSNLQENHLDIRRVESQAPMDAFATVCPCEGGEKAQGCFLQDRGTEGK